jgi:hypothetical protein
MCAMSGGVQGDSEAILNPTTGQDGGSRAQSDATATLNKISNIASILCAIDCTVFPVLLTILPILNAAGSAGAVAWLHTASHAAALWFVAPVGTTSVTANYLQHKRGFVFAWGLSGIFLVLLANVHLPHMIFGLTVPHSVGHALHANHSVINVLGCGVLLSSQRYARSLIGCSTCCNHEHGHDHEHGGSTCGRSSS